LARNDKEESRPFDAAQLSGTQDDELLPSVRHFQCGGNNDRGDHKDNAKIKVPYRA
jgi:hypothetical protein